MKHKRRFGIVVFGVTLLTGGCLATDPSTDPLDLPELVTFQAVAVGAQHSCGLTLSNEILCWGTNSSGQLGTADNVSRTIPWPVVQGTTEFSRVVSGAAHSCALSTANEVFCWGDNNAGQLGLGDLTSPQVSVPREVGGGRSYGAVAAGGAHSCALTTNRAAFCWGNGAHGQLGTGYIGTVPRPIPDSVLGDLTFDHITAGTVHTCGRTVGGEAYCWGLGQHGRLGVGSTQNLTEPTRVGDNMQFSTISAGETHTCAVDLDGTAYCWGDGSAGQLGTGNLDGSEVPVPVAGALLFREISAGGWYTCGVTTGDGSTYCWGRNNRGQLGDGTSEDRVEPTLVGDGRSFETVSTGLGSSSATCGLGSDGLVYCWGDGGVGQTGTGEQIVTTTPTRVFGQSG